MLGEAFTLPHFRQLPSCSASPFEDLFLFLVLAYGFKAVDTEALKCTSVRQLKEFNVDNVNCPLGL